MTKLYLNFEDLYYSKNLFMLNKRHGAKELDTDKFVPKHIPKGMESSLCILDGFIH